MVQKRSAQTRISRLSMCQGETSRVGDGKFVGTGRRVHMSGCTCTGAGACGNRVRADGQRRSMQCSCVICVFDCPLLLLIPLLFFAKDLSISS